MALQVMQPYPRSNVGSSHCFSSSFKKSSNSCLIKCLVVFGSLSIVADAAGSSGASCSGSSRRLGSGAPWYCEYWERDHLEAVSSVAMTLLGFVFENVYHKMQHKAEHGYVYGRRLVSDKGVAQHHSAEAEAFKRPLRLVLLSRMGGEFMVLGFLAFTIWTCNQQGLFDALADMDQGSIRLPTDGADYLHLMEAVHMQLFIGMVLYFTLSFFLVAGTDGRIRDYELNRGLWIEQIKEGIIGILDADSPSLRSFKLWRGHFLDGAVSEILSWRQSKPKIFTEVMKLMKVETEETKITKAELQQCFTDRFSFTSYLVFSVLTSTQEVVNVTPLAFLGIVVIKSLYVFLHRFAHITADAMNPVLNLLCFVFILAINFGTSAFKRSLEKSDEEESKKLRWIPRLVDRASHTVNPEQVLLTILQVLLFFLCYTWSGHMIDKDFWSDIFKRGKFWPLFKAIAYISTLCSLIYMIPRCVPDFSAVMSLPPFFSHKNQKTMELVAVQVVDKAMVNARAAVKMAAQKEMINASTMKDKDFEKRKLLDGTDSGSMAPSMSPDISEVTVGAEDTNNFSNASTGGLTKDKSVKTLLGVPVDSLERGSDGSNQSGTSTKKMGSRSGADQLRNRKAGNSAKKTSPPSPRDHAQKTGDARDKALSMEKIMAPNDFDGSIYVGKGPKPESPESPGRPVGKRQLVDTE